MGVMTLREEIKRADYNPQYPCKLLLVGLLDSTPKYQALHDSDPIQIMLPGLLLLVAEFLHQAQEQHDSRSSLRRLLSLPGPCYRTALFALPVSFYPTE